MIVETAQIICTVLREKTSYRNKDALYKSTHVKHPIVIWAGTCAENAIWCDELCYRMCLEYRHRFKREHKTYKMFTEHFPYQDWSRDPHRPCYAQLLPNKARTPFVNCSLFKNETDVHLAYRKTLIKKWSQLDVNIPRWTNRQPPEWYDGPSKYIVGGKAL